MKNSYVRYSGLYVVLATALWVGCSATSKPSEETLGTDGGDATVEYDVSHPTDESGTTDDSSGFTLGDAADSPGGCIAKTCASLGANCGAVTDGCGALLACGACTAPQICGGGGTANVCGGASACKAKTCADLGATCGPVGDGCGGVIPTCGTCTSPDICGGGGKPSVCGSGTSGTTPTCVNLACKQTTCTGTATTSLSGVVYDPAGLRPLYNVVVYVPNSKVAALGAGASCDKCSAALSGSPLVTALTDEKGAFKLTNMPVGVDIPVVFQIGKWRRQTTVTTSKCVDTVIDKDKSRLPKSQSEGDIPKIALATGSADPLECLLRKIGIADSEFTNPTGTGRVNLFSGANDTFFFPPTNAYNAKLGGATFPAATSLWASDTSLKAYDVVLLGCEGSPTMTNKPAAALTAMQKYTSEGGKVFGEHYHYVWLQSGPPAWPGIASWLDDTFYATPMTDTLNTGFPKGASMSKWLVNVGASPKTAGQIQVNEGKHSIVKLVDTTNTTEWIYADKQKDTSGKVVTHGTQYFSFNTPLGAAADSQCGRFVFSDIHVSSGDATGTAFPDGCTTTSMTAQELALEFMLFDLSSPVCDEHLPPTPPTCVPTTCAAAGLSCGPAADGCGGLLDCGKCTPPDTCGGSGTPGKCGHASCTKSTCAAQGIECGAAGDGCGGLLDCGKCTPPATCGGGGTPYKCGGVH